MKKIIDYFIALLVIILGVMFTSLPIIVYGDANPTVTISNVSSTEKKELEQLMSDLHSNMVDEGLESNSSTDTYRFVSGTYNSTDKLYTIKIDKSSYSKKNQEAKQDIMHIALSTINNSGVSRINRVKIYNFIADLDTSTSSLVRQLDDDVDADFADAYMTFKPFTGVIGWVLGCLCLSIFIFLALTISIDIAYIVLPIVQIWLFNEEKQKAKFVSIEAQKAVEMAAKSEGSNYSNPMSFYFKHKTKQFIAIAICILYLVSGKIYTLIATIMDSFMGVIG